MAGGAFGSGPCNHDFGGIQPGGMGTLSAPCCSQGRKVLPAWHHSQVGFAVVEGGQGEVVKAAMP